MLSFPYHWCKRLPGIRDMVDCCRIQTTPWGYLLLHIHGTGSRYPKHIFKTTKKKSCMVLLTVQCMPFWYVFTLIIFVFTHIVIIQNKNHTRTHAHTHARRHTHKHERTHESTHAHSLPSSLSPSFPFFCIPA